MSYATATRLTPVEQSMAGGATDLTAALDSPDGTNGNKFYNDPGRTWLRVKNTGAVKTLTIETPNTISGLAIADKTVTITATTGDQKIGPFDGAVFHQPGTNDVFISFDSVTGVTVKVYHLQS